MTFVDGNQETQQTIIQYWGPIEVLLEERFPSARSTRARIELAGKDDKYSLLKKDLLWLDHERNKTSHPPYMPSSDITKFRSLSAKELAYLRRLRESHAPPTSRDTSLHSRNVKCEPIALGATHSTSALRKVEDTDNFPQRPSLQRSTASKTVDTVCNLAPRLTDTKNFLAVFIRSCPECGQQIEPFESGGLQQGDFLSWDCDCGWSDSERY